MLAAATPTKPVQVPVSSAKLTFMRDEGVYVRRGPTTSLAGLELPIGAGKEAGCRKWAPDIPAFCIALGYSHQI